MTDSRGADRRLTLTQSPFVDGFAKQLSQETGLSRADLFNIAMQAMAVTLGIYARGHDCGDPALRVILGDILAARNETQEE